MSFVIFAAGSGHFHRRRTGIDFGDVYDFAAGLSRMMSVTGGARAFAQDEVTGALSPTSPLEQALNVEGQIHGFRLLNDAVTLLVARFTPVNISVAPRVSNALWADTNAFAQITFRNDDYYPGQEFLRAVNPALERTGMNTFGVLAAMARVISEFSHSSPSRGTDGRYRLSIQLSA